MKVTLSEPIVVAMGPDSRTAPWGPYQFPTLWKLEDGRLVYTFCADADSEAAYNAEQGCCVSEDMGKTWTRAKKSDFNDDMGILLPNGDRVRMEDVSSIPMEGLKLPEPIGTSTLGHVCYRIADMDPDICPLTWRIYRKAKGEEHVVLENVKLDWKHMILRSFRDVLVPPSVRGRLRIAPDGTLWMPHYYLAGTDPVDGHFIPYLCNYLFKSVDGGKTWENVQFLPYLPDDGLHSPKYEGYGENDITFCPDGSMIRLIRLNSVAPSVYTRSEDGGKTWTEPQIFDNHGVWPCLLTLGCGVTLASYGRPGLTLRATADPSCKEWDKPMELIHAPLFDEGVEHHGTMSEMATCGYSQLIALDDHTAMLAYSDFNVKDADGVPRKCMMCRTVTVEN